MLYIIGTLVFIYLLIGFLKVVANRIQSNAQAQMWGRTYAPPLSLSLRWMLLWPKYL